MDSLSFTKEQLDYPKQDNPLTQDQMRVIREQLLPKEMRNITTQAVQGAAERALRSGDRDLQAVVDWLQEL